jgi:chromosome partitioning protein
VYDLLTDDRVQAADVLHRVSENLSVIPAEVNLAGAEAELAPKLVDGRAQRVLKRKMESVLRDGGCFDFVLIDCPPSLGLLTVNALTFVNEVIVPMQAHFLSLQGLSKLLETVMLIRQSFNERLSVAGVVLCMHEKQTILAGEVSNDLRAFLEQARGQDVPWADAVVFEPTIRRNIKLAESPSFGRTIFDYEPDCAGAQDYLAVAKNVAARVRA